MKKYVLGILSIVLFVACNPARYMSKAQDLPIQIQVEDTVSMGETVFFKIKNNHPETLTIFYPQKLWIEKQQGNIWKKLKILECLCDAPCQASEDKMLIEPGAGLKLSWNQKESWCGSRIKGQIRETIFKQVTAGKYKIVIRYRTEDGEDSSYSQEFEITS